MQINFKRMWTTDKGTRNKRTIQKTKLGKIQSIQINEMFRH